MENQIIKRLEKIEQCNERIEYYTMMAAKNVLNIDDVAFLTGFSRSWIYKLTSEKKIPYYKHNNKQIFFDRVEIENWLKEVKVATAAEIDLAASQYIAANTASNGYKRGGRR